MITDQEDFATLWAACARGEGRAWACLYRTRYGKIFGYVRSHRLAGALADGEVDDLVQVAFERLFLRRETFDASRGAGGLHAWLCRVANNLIIDELRRRRLPTTSDQEDAYAHVASLDSFWDNGDGFEIPDRDDHASMELGWDLRRCLGRLPGPQQQAFQLHYLDGLSLEEIAAQQEVSINTVGTRLFRARAALRECLASDGP